MDAPDKHALARTLELADIAPIPPLNRIKILDASKRDTIQNKRVRDASNRLLLDLVRANDLGVCVHVTGEMRALADPFHRQVCEEMRRRDEGAFDVLYHIPPDRQHKAASVVGWNLSSWAEGRERNWEEELRTIDAIGRRSVALFAYDTLDHIQYSVFGHKYVLLQEKHQDGVPSKRIWLLESEQVNGLLTERSRVYLAGATEIDEGLFHEFAANVSGIAARRYLRQLDHARVDKELLLADKFIRGYVEEPQDVIDALTVMRFVGQDPDGRLTITPAGRHFLSSY